MSAALKFQFKLGKTAIHIYKTVIKISASIVSLQFGTGAVASKIATKVVWWMGRMKRRHEHFRVQIMEPRKSRQTSLCYCVAG